MNDIEKYENIPEIKKNNSVKVRRYHNLSLEEHWHEHIEILYILSGCARMKIASGTFNVSEGNTVIINSNELHSFIAEDIMDYICIIVNPKIFDEVNYPNIILKSKVEDDTNIYEYAKRIYDEMQNNDKCSDMIIKGETFLLMAYLIKNYTIQTLSRYEYDIRIDRMRKVNMFLDYIHSNYNKPLSTADLAKEYYLSESHLCRIFKRAVGMSVVEYINRFRVDRAEMLLKNTDENVCDIAQKVGFDNLNYFDRVFKKYKNVSPKESRLSGKILSERD